jgi:two-component system, OmpR family, sensor histidine kinase KdpD
MEREMNSKRLRTIDERFSRWSVSGNHPIAGIVIGLALITALVPGLQHLHGAAGTLGPSIPLFFLVPVLLSSAVGGSIVGTALSIVAVTVWDWFFIPPFYAFTVYSPRDVFALLVFLAVALLTGQLAAGVRRRAQEALRRAAGAEALYELSTALIARRDLISVLEALTARLQRAFNLEACAILLPERTADCWRTAAVAGKLPAKQRVESNRTLHGMAVWVNAHGEPSRLPKEGVELLPLRSGDRSVGVLQLAAPAGERLDGEREQLLRTFANGAAIAIEQARLAQEERVAALALESDRLKTALLSSVSHDLRTPLAGIKAAATSLLQEDIQWSAEDRRAFASDIDAEADRLTRLVSNLLDLSRIEAGGIQPDREWEDVADMILRVVERSAPQLKAHPVSTDVPADLPPVYLDAVQIEQVLTNLLENAAKYSPDGSPISITATVAPGPDDESELRISVVDHGPGISRIEQDRVFDKFYRIRGSSRRTAGTGMGLAIVRGLVAAHDGRVWVESEPGSGSTFVIALPLLHETPAQPIEESHAPHPLEGIRP